MAKQTENRELFIGAWINSQGNKYKIVSLGKSLNSRIRLYVNGKEEGIYATRKQAKAIGQKS